MTKIKVEYKMLKVGSINQVTGEILVKEFETRTEANDWISSQPIRALVIESYGEEALLRIFG